MRYKKISQYSIKMCGAHKQNIKRKLATQYQEYSKQELQEVLKFPIEIFWNLEASLKSELLYL